MPPEQAQRTATAPVVAVVVVCSSREATRRGACVAGCPSRRRETNNKFTRVAVPGLPATARPLPVAPDRRPTPIGFRHDTWSSSATYMTSWTATFPGGPDHRHTWHLPQSSTDHSLSAQMLHREKTLGATGRCRSNYTYCLARLQSTKFAPATLPISIRLPSQIHTCHRASAVHKHGEQGCEKKNRINMAQQV